MKKIRVLIVDDSVYMQLALRSMLLAHSEIEIVGAASDGESAVAMAFELLPDLITMDVTMPGIDGVEATRRILRQISPAIVMLSNLTEKGASATFVALEAGAVDYVAKSGSAVDIDLRTVAELLSQKVLFWGRRAIEAKSELVEDPPVELPDADLQIFLGGGGSQALTAQILRARSRTDVPVLIVPNITAKFIAPFVDYVARASKCRVFEAGARLSLRSGAICVVPGERRGVVTREPTDVLRIALGRQTEGFDFIVSAATAAKAPHLIVMSGDPQPTSGWEAAFAKSRANVWVQDPEHCALDGMPNAILTKRIRSQILTPRAMVASFGASTRRSAA